MGIAECEGAVTRNGELDVCGKPAVCVKLWPEEWDEHPSYPGAACAYHAHQSGSALPITNEIADAIIASNRRRRHVRPEIVTTQDNQDRDNE